jgi:hypothetical protein
MLQIPAQLANQFATYINQQGVPSRQHRYYVKWMRYYLDFCHKYQLDQGVGASLPAFLKKLEQKKQTIQLQKQAEHAVRLYFAFANPPKKQQDYREKGGFSHSTRISTNTHRENRQEYKSSERVARQPEDPSGKNKVPAKRGADWTEVFTALQNGIRVRHYSPAKQRTLIKKKTTNRDAIMSTSHFYRNLLKRL